MVVSGEFFISRKSLLPEEKCQTLVNPLFSKRFEASIIPILKINEPVFY